MPLSEFLRMAGRKIESGQQRPHPSGPSSRLTNDFDELVWQNGQVTMQGPSSRFTRAVNHSLPPDTSRSRDSGLEKFSGVESILDEMPPILVPSPGLGLSQDDEMGPWIEALTQDYNSLLLPEVSGVRTNPISTYNNSLLSSVSTLHSDGGGSSRARLPDSWPPPQHPSPRVSDAVGSGVSCILRNENSTNNSNNVITHNHQDVVNDSNGVKNMRNTHNGSNYLNFSLFARPANLMKARASSSNEKAEVKEKGAEASGSTRMKSALIGRFNSVSSAKLAEACPRQLSSVRTVKESCPAERMENLCQEKLTKNDKALVVNSATDSSKWLPSSENVVEPVVASSSVGSGNSADRVSSERRHTMKRKFCDAEDSECRSDDVETESVGVRKGTLSRGGGSKRSRAAEVHNLSERRRRDRINEKMRALQELIPNCNKADKASMLDEAIEYLKSLQLQVQIMSMGAGLCMPQMMFPTGMQHMHHPPHMPHLSPMGMGMNMSFGMSMMDMNGGFPISHFHNSIPASFQRLPGTYPSWYGHHPGQVLPNTVTGQPPLNPHMGLSNGGQNTVPGELANMNQQLNCNTEAAGSIDPKSVKPNATNEVLNPAVTVQETKQMNDAGGPSTLTSATPSDTSKEPGF